ncbi:MAG TPA: biopolymer transporter ExbD [Limnochordia bacterium]|nr:biopolymer transporter ExbD [Limnochordia bacterium]
MRFETSRRIRYRQPRVEMLPMIDVIMFLLVFFMLFTTFRTVESGIEVDLPRAATGEQQPPAHLVVTITQSGAIYLDGRLSNLSAIRQAAERLARENSQATLIIRGDSRAYWEHAVGVMDAARQGGISRFAFGTQPPES